MRIEAKKRDFDAATQVVTLGVAGGDDGDLSTHYLFRALEGGKCDVLASNGQRILAGALIAGATLSNAEAGDSFTVPGWRFRGLLGAAGGDDDTVSVEYDGVGRFESPKGKFKLGSLNPKDFPFWNETLANAKSVGKVPVSRLASILSYVKSFVSDAETRSPALVATECSGGVVRATDSVAVTLVTTPVLDGSNLRIHGKDIPLVLSFLALKGSDDVEVLEHDRCLFLRRDGDQNLIGVSRWPSDFPVLKINKDDPDKCYFSVETEKLLGAMRLLEFVAKKDDERLQFRFNQTSVEISMESGSGDGEDVQEIPFIEHDKMGTLKDEGYDGFCLSKKYIKPIAEHFGTGTFRFGVNWTKKNGYVTFRQDRDGDNYFTLVVWVRK